MVKTLVNAFLLVIGFADLVASRAYMPDQFFPQQTHQSTCVPIGSSCEPFNILSQCCPGLVCREVAHSGVKITAVESRCETLYGGGYLGGVGSGIGTGIGAGVGPGYGAGVGPGYGAGVGPGYGAGVGPGYGAGYGAGIPGGIGMRRKSDAAAEPESSFE